MGRNKKQERMAVWCRLALLTWFLFAGLVAYAGTDLSVQVKLWLDHDFKNDTGISVTRDNTQIRAEQEYADGTSSSTAQADLLWYGQRSLASGASEDLDLAGGVSDVFGNTLTFTRIKAVHIKNTSNTQTLTVGGATNPFAGPLLPATATVSIPPAGFIFWQSPYAGFAVGAGSADEIRVTNSSGATTTYNIWVIGGSQ